VSARYLKEVKKWKTPNKTRKRPSF